MAFKMELTIHQLMPLVSNKNLSISNQGLHAPLEICLAAGVVQTPAMVTPNEFLNS